MDYNFVEVMQNFDRMCQQYDYVCDADECPIAALMDKWEKESHEIWTRDCVYYGSKYPKEFADAVMQWAEAHQYPTIGEVVEKLCSIMGIEENVDMIDVLDTPLTEAAANYLNIKNGKLV